jgi:hypothetical protein
VEAMDGRMSRIKREVTMWRRLSKLIAQCGSLMALGLCCTTALSAQGASPSVSYDATHSGATLVVSPGCTLVINFVKNDGTAHSAEVIADKDPMPDMGEDPAIAGAYTRDVTQGQPQGATDVLRFTAPSGDSYRIFCGVPGQGLPGMWIRFKVGPARVPAPIAG